MALTCNTPTGTPFTHLSLRRRSLFNPTSPSSLAHDSPSRGTRLRVSAAKKFSSATGRFDSKKRRSLTPTKEEEEKEEQFMPSEGIPTDSGTASAVDDGFVMPELPGEKPDFWEGPQWDPFGFFVQYLWAFGIVFALISSGIAVATYNEGATDFKATPAYKESIQSQELLEEPDSSNSDVFESNPTEEAPPLE